MKPIRLIVPFVFLLAAAVSATVFQPTTDRQLVDRSATVVVATVRGASTHVRPDGYVATDYRLDVERTLKGTAAETITVSEIGGAAGGRFTFIADSAVFTPGERVMVFLKQRPDGTYFTTSMALGKFSYTRNATGASVLTRDVSEMPDDPARIADGFEQFVRDGKSVAYATTLTPIAIALRPRPLAAASAYVLTGCGVPGCFPVRVPGGESGGGLAFKSHGTIAGGVDGPGGISNAVAMWTSDPGSFIVLSYTGTTATLTPNPDDGESDVFLDYSGSDIGLCDAGQACTLGAGNFTHTFKGETFVGITDADIIIRPGLSAAQYGKLISHEVGHAIGFRHSDAGTPTSFSALMSSTVSVSSLQSWDQEALSIVYGNGPVCQAPTSVSISGGGTVPPGQTATLVANVAGGSSPFTYQWYDGVAPDTSTPVGTNNATFTTPPINSTKNYWVKVSNTCGNVTASTSVSPQGATCTPVTISTQPSGTTVNSGGAATLSVGPAGTPPFTYQWYQATSTADTTKPVGTNSPSFTTPALTQSTSFWVMVTNQCGSIPSNVVTITVNTGGCTKPSFTTQPSSASPVTGSQTILIALATGANSYQWYKGNTGDTSTPVAGSGPSNDRWINQIYIDLLGRPADAAGLSAFGGLLAGGASRTTVATNVLSSAEYRTRLLTNFYTTFLHRSPLAGEVSFWLPAFVAGLSDEQIEAQFMASAEYFALAGGSNSGWINLIFNDVLGRVPSAPELASFTTLLGSSSRTSVGLAILNSSEAATRRVQPFYPRFLRRSPLVAETTALTNAFLGGNSDEQLIALVVGSDEYFNFGTLLITDVISATTSYWVRATNTCGTADSNTAILTIPQCQKPVILAQPQNVTVHIGTPLTVSVLASGASSYQWYRASSGDPTNPIAAGTGPVLSIKALATSNTDYWVKVTNSCGSTNSNSVTVTVDCVPRTLTMSVPPTATSASTYTVSWDGDAQVDFRNDLQEATKSDFSDAVTFQVTGANSRNFTHTVTTDTRYYYRAGNDPLCGGAGPYSPAGSILVTAPQAPNLTNYNFANPPCTSNCTITQQLFIPGIPVSGKDALATGDQFSVASDKPFMTVSPATGALPPEGATVTVSIDTSQLDFGATQGSVTINRTPAAGKVGALGNPPPPTTVPVSVSVVAPVTQTPKTNNAPFNSLLIPAIAHADGIGTRFVSDVRLTNTAAQSITYQLTFTPANSDGTKSGKQLTLTIAGGDTKALNDIVKDWYGSGVLGEPGIGSLEIRPLNYSGKDPVSVSFASVASSRTYSVTAAGTFGQFIPALPLANFLIKSDVSKISLQQVAQSSAAGGFRTNLGFVEGSGSAVNFVATLLDDNGNKLAERAYSLKPFESQQIRLDAFFNATGITLPNIADGRVEVRVTSDTGKVTAYASVLDNTTTDPLLVFPADPSKISASRFVVPGVAEFDNSFSNFHTDMRIYNGGTSSVDVTLAFTGASVPNKVKTIAAGATLALNDVLPTLWGITGGGSVVATTASDSQLVVTARTFSRDKTNGGTFGQFIPGVTAADAVGNGERALQIVQLEESPSFRTNLGLVEVTGNPASVELLAYTPDSKLASRTVVPLAAGQYLQQGQIFKSLGFSNVYNGRISAKVISGTGRVAAYGSVIDNRTTDPTYVPSQ